jgi:acetylglutamate/LysW-gamma-L-alpha-aminoadipate kinase
VIVVVKVGGRGGIDVSSMCADIAGLTAQGAQVVLVHGGSGEMEELAERLGVELRDLIAPDGVVTRRTDEATLDTLTLALAGRVKPALLIELARHDVRAIGLTGIDGGLLRARRRKAIRSLEAGRTVVVRDDHSGRIDSVDTGLLRGLLGLGLVPVVSPPALAEDGNPVNVNADRVAGAIAVALGADRLVFLTDVPGVLADQAVVRELRLPGTGITGGMGIKLVAAGQALAGGVSRVYIAGGGGREPISLALAGKTGTRVLTEQEAECAVE